MRPEADATTWVAVSAGALERNYRAVANYAGTTVCAVVKANAYGHGLAEAARTFESAGARWLAVTRVEEARTLRGAGIESHILILTPPPTAGLAAEAVSLDAALTASDAADVDRYAAAARDAGRPARVHLKIDTGMGRLGVPVSEAAAVAERIAAEEQVSLDGVFTHFAGAAGPSGAAQLSRFRAVREALGKHAARAIVHASNSAALLKLPGARFDMVRIGTLLYGQNPPGATAPFSLEETFQWYARVVAVRTVPAGTKVGYGGEWTAKKPVRLATIPIGWGDGFTAEPHARSETLAAVATGAAKAIAVAAGARPTPRVVLFGSQKAKVVGRAGMQAITVSLEGLPGVAVGDVARIPARRLLVAGHIDRIYGA
ncbi:MAG TPA: alanine racemase [Actinomycetota bacterium]|nr:alanine racemase [Actinomycetota bacterium]